MIIPKRPRIHIGSGRQRLEGWVNVDIRPFPEVDVVADVTAGLDFEEAEAVYAEHFLEHLAIDQALDFLAEVHRVLAGDGWLRLSTPNLEWVWLAYRFAETPAEKRRGALQMNLAFRGWEHKFLWNRALLERALVLVGFTGLRWCRYGESDLSMFAGIERHPTDPDSDEYPHVLIVEATKGRTRPEELAAFREEIGEGFLRHMAGY